MIVVEIPTRSTPVVADLDEDGIFVYDTKSRVEPGEVYTMMFVHPYPDSGNTKYFRVKVTAIEYSRRFFIKRKIGWHARFL